jgi:hypothetical protein
MDYFKFLFLISLFSCSQYNIVNNKFVDREPATFQTCFESLNQIIKKTKPPTASIKENFSKINSLEELETVYGDRSFIDIQSEASQQEILDNNKRFYELLEQPISKFESFNKTSYILPEEADVIFNDIEAAKVNVNNACYDPKGTVGFCFGRATMVHMEALIRNVASESVRKIWIAGDMGVWGHHVATLIKGQEGWYIIDIEVGKVVKVQEWFKFFKKYQPENANEMMLFISKAERFGPYDTSGYTSRDLFNTTNNKFKRDSDFYRGFFHDYFEELEMRQKTVKKFPVR